MQALLVALPKSKFRGFQDTSGYIRAIDVDCLLSVAF